MQLLLYLPWIIWSSLLSAAHPAEPERVPVKVKARR